MLDIVNQSVVPFLFWSGACSKICYRFLNELGEYGMDFEVTMKTLGLMLVGLLVSVAGCQTGHTVQTSALENGSFMSLWNSYSRCQTATNIDEMTADAATLTHAANSSLSHEAFILPLPSDLQQFVATPAARSAVDVKAMAASCALRAGFAAKEGGNLTWQKTCSGRFSITSPNLNMLFMFCKRRSCFLNLKGEAETKTRRYRYAFPRTHCFVLSIQMGDSLELSSHPFYGRYAVNFAR